MNRYETGLAKFESLAGEKGMTALSEVQSKFPELANHIIDFAYGDIHANEEISERESELLIIGSLVTQGAFDQLGMHYHISKQVGISERELRVALLRCIPYVGIPKVMSAFAVLDSMQK